MRFPHVAAVAKFADVFPRVLGRNVNVGAIGQVEGGGRNEVAKVHADAIVLRGGMPRAAATGYATVKTGWGHSMR
jgi:hypothetical protein